jgi:hypothetical protein
VCTARILLLVLSFDFRRHHGLREISASASPSSGLAWPRFCISPFDSSTEYCVAKSL